MPGFDFAAWIGVMVAAGTSKPIVNRLAAVVDQAMRSPDVRDRLAAAGVEVDYRRTDEFTRLPEGAEGALRGYHQEGKYQNRVTVTNDGRR